MNSRARFPGPALALAIACAGVFALPPVSHAQGLRLGATPAPTPGNPRLPLASRVVPPRPLGPQQADYIVAVVNSEPITNNEVRMRMARFEQQILAAGQAIPPRPEFMRQVLDRLISEKAQLQLARENGMKVEESTLDVAEQNIARSNQMDVAELRRQLVAEGSTVQAFREDLRNQILLQRLRDRETEAKARVSDLELDQYIRDQQGKLEIGAPEYNIGHILIAVPETATDVQFAALRDKAARAYQRLKAGEDFSKVAREVSDAPGATTNGGVIGRRPLDRLPPIFAQAVQPLPEGAVADPIRTAAGIHLIKVLEKRRNVLDAGATVEQTHARHILLRVGPQMTEAQAVQQLQDFKRRVESGQAQFADLAREFSADGSAAKGGDLGWTNPGTFVPEFDEVVNALQPGQVSDPVVSRFGVHLVQLIERRQQPLTQREQRDLVRSVLREKKMDEVYSAWAQEVRGRAFVELREPPQ